MTGTIMLVAAFVIAGRFIYRRYMPLLGVSCLSMETLAEKDDGVVLDIRDYQTVHSAPVKGSVNIPMAYLSRQYRDAGNGRVYLVASGVVDVHLAARFLKKKGIDVQGFSVKNSSYVCRQRPQEV
ncbi:rhodanese-like domain-containing protein [Alteribacter natronophilus]|uniref:rhodanese-like domain-containing protein n=1 Tax=Alteribacter natronophilus TaxID=2583810 RepID=UPI00110F2144|nr:rhodanese-like domain-containing protein [Alteribacter natronophilus]TMW70118.1 rhodanese-like domain-containing protein [Alteribacter natronophilus]